MGGLEEQILVQEVKGKHVLKRRDHFLKSVFPCIEENMKGTKLEGCVGYCMRWCGKNWPGANLSACAFIPMAGVWQRTSWLRTGQMAMADADKKRTEKVLERKRKKEK